MHFSIGVVENCKNPESYGTICVRCNLCGRFDKTTDNDCTTEKQLNSVVSSESLEECE